MDQARCYQCGAVVQVPAHIQQFQCGKCGATNNKAPIQQQPMQQQQHYPPAYQQHPPPQQQHAYPPPQQQQYPATVQQQPQAQRQQASRPQPSAQQIGAANGAGFSEPQGNNNRNNGQSQRPNVGGGNNGNKPSKQRAKPRTLLEKPTEEERAEMAIYYEEPSKFNFHGETHELPKNPPCICYWASCTMQCDDTVQPHCCWLVPCSKSGCKPCSCCLLKTSGQCRWIELACPCNGSPVGLEEALFWQPWYHAHVCCCLGGYPPKRYPGDCCYFETCGFNQKDRVHAVYNDIRVRHLNDEKLWQRALCGCASWGCCLGYWLCMPCCAYKQRKDGLRGDLTRYRCCQDRYCQGERYMFHCIDNGLESCEKKPEMALCCESVCCTYCAVHATREMVWDEINVKTDPCDIRLARWENLAVQVCWPLNIALEIFNTLGQGFQGGGPCACCCEPVKAILSVVLDIFGLGCITDFMSAECCGTLLQFTECLECLTDCVVVTYLISLCRCGCLMAQLYPELKDMNRNV